MHRLVPQSGRHNVQANQRSIDVLHYEINLALQPENKYLTGYTRLSFVAKSDILDKVDLDFIGLTIDSVYHNENITTYDRQNDILVC